MKKILILIILVLFLTGCSAKYSLTYKNDLYEESLSIIGDKNEIIDGDSFENLINNYYNNIPFLIKYSADPGDMSKDDIIKKYEIYNKELINRSNYGMKLFYSYKEIDEYKDSSIINSLYSDVNITKKHIFINDTKNIYDEFPYLDDIIISFETDKLVAKNNADKIKNNTYYWYINRENYSTKIISIDFANNILDTIKPIGNEKTNIIIDIFIAFISIMVLFGIIKVYDRIKNSNK